MEERRVCEGRGESNVTEIRQIKPSLECWRRKLHDWWEEGEMNKWRMKKNDERSGMRQNKYIILRGSYVMRGRG